MNKLISIIGNSGAGKTLLTRRLCEAGPFQPCLEQHQERPFQQLFMQDLTGPYALPNQFDYLLYRAEQEWAARQSDEIHIMDGGLDLDYHLFSHYFYQKGYLNDAGLQICARFYTFCRKLLPSPDLTIYLAAPLPILVERRQIRNRAVDITQSDDLDLMQGLLDLWLNAPFGSPLIRIDASNDPDFAASLPGLIAAIKAL